MTARGRTPLSIPMAIICGAGLLVAQSERGASSTDLLNTPRQLQLALKMYF